MNDGSVSAIFVLSLFGLFLYAVWKRVEELEGERYIQAEEDKKLFERFVVAVENLTLKESINASDA